MSPVESVQVTLADRGDLAAMLALSNESAARSVANFATAPEPLDEWVEAFERASAAYPWLVVGTFEFFATRGDHEAIAALATYALQRHYPDAVDTGNDALALLERVIDAQATLVARWLGVAFVHGVMNTDNTSISGETLDYGPCAFLDEYDPKKKFSSIDHGGR
jgi:uncharacterized protein YdiU (UPF0061 family)